ncbi:MAG TPA: alpha/beta hydrolase domain-containing protein [Gemmataceae bacterium]
MRVTRTCWAVLCAAGLAAGELRAEVVELRVERREPFAGGKAFGDAGPYEKIVGVAEIALDPADERNKLIVDLALAPRGDDGRVRVLSDFCILAPKDPAKGNGVVFYDVNNRGNKLALRFFNDAPGGNDPTGEKDAGNGFLFRQGYTVVWCGWIGELLPGGGRMLLKAPIAQENGGPIRGIVRYEMVTDTPAESMPLSRRPGHGSYPPTERGEAEGILTWRMRETDPRVPIPNSQWSLERKPVPEVKRGVPGTLPEVRLHLSGGFRPGYIYELVCEAEGPIVQGCGFAAVRDLISFLRYEGGAGNPLARDGKSPVRHAIGFGVSQSGRFLRHFVYQGFNVDEHRRRVFDGLMPHVAGGGLGFFNHRFAQPTRHNGQHEEHLYPADVFPFTYGDSVNPFILSGGQPDGILRRTAAENPALLPKVMHTQSAAEYWHRSGSLVHTDPLGRRDVPIPEGVRIYAFGGTQHGPAADPPSRGIADNLHNPADYRPLLRGLLVALTEWVRDGKPPPPSVYPRIDRGTLVGWSRKETGFPALPGVRYPEVIQQPPFCDYGPLFESRGIISNEPPTVLNHYRVLVPKSDADGNDLGTLLIPDVAVPLATYTGWNLRGREAGAEGMLASLLGSYIPFPKTEEERRKTGDPRRSVAERYGSFDDYRKKYEAYCRKLVEARYLLEEDAERLTGSREKLRGMFP